MPLQDSRATALAFLSLFPALAHAGASLYIDDAAITPAGHCQLESWARAYSPGRELTVAPACNVAGTEFGLGLSHYTQPVASNLWSVGIKHLFRDFDAQPWGMGVSLAASRDDLPERTTSWSANVPVSIALDADHHAVLHANIGWSKSNGRSGAVTGGAGLEFAVSDSWTLLGELYGDHHGTALGQFGLRSALSENASLDMLIGHQDDMDSSPWLTLGLNITFPR